MVRLSFSAGRKSFTLEKAGNIVLIKETNHKGVSSLDLPLDAAEWMVSKFKLLTRLGNFKGKLGSKAFTGLDLILTVKENDGGFFISILAFFKGPRKGSVAVYCPKNRNRSKTGGWESFLSALQAVLGEKRGAPLA
ncbi:hypothetical protein ACHQM5_026076 [Ranunculus cassubicifolius]